MIKLGDTIVAIASPHGTGAIGVVRLSGDEALNIVNRFLNKPVSRPRYVHYRELFDTSGNLVDEVLVVYFKAPKSYTGEDMVEIYCHGGVLVTQKVLNTMLNGGARLAKNGEFTKRAFLNGKIDLIKAEAVLQVIEAKSEKALKLALDNLKGRLSKEIEFFRQKILDILAKIEVSIDYSDDVIVDDSEIRHDITSLLEMLRMKIEMAGKGLHLSTGVTLTIVGKPNTGKSTLLNCLLNEDRAIVTDIPGTTRDVIRGEIKIGGVHFVISDTAGVRETKDVIEKIGIERTLREVQKSDVVIFLLDATTGFTDDDRYIYELIKETNFLTVWNKIDLVTEVQRLGDDDVLISAKTGEGLRVLEQKLLEKVRLIVEEGELSHVTSKRQLEYLKRVYANISNAYDQLKKGYPFDIISIDLRKALEEFDELLGRNYVEDLIDTIFSNFCVGK